MTSRHSEELNSTGFSRPIALVVDDEPLVAQFLIQTLEDKGFGASHAPTVRAALAAVAAQTFTVAFVDLGLPDRSGLELIAELKRLHPSLPIVIATGYAEMAKDDSETHLSAVLAKPYDARAVVKVLNTLGVSIPS